MSTALKTGPFAAPKGVANVLLNIQTSKIGADIVVVGVAGRITLGRECQEVEYQGDLLKANQKKIIFDFSRLEFLDSTG